jgi:hypothetical protein
MRTKTLLLSAAALAAGLVSSQAQNVYSANVVGYANVVLHGNGQYSLVANPFDDGNGNYLTNILNGALPRQSQVLTFDSAAGYTTVQKVGTPASFPAGTTNQLLPGVGFFVRNGNPGGGAPDLTNTFVGSIIVPNGSSVTNSEGLGYTLQSSPIPYAGNVAILGQNGGDTNMDFGGPLTRQSQILTWDPVAGFNTFQKVGSPTATWNGTATVNVGDGFFVFNKNGPVTNAVETLNLQ